MDDLENMYSNDENESEVADTQKTNSINIANKSNLTELTIDGKKISIFDYKVILQLNDITRKLEKRIIELENSMQYMRRQMAFKDQQISRLSQELENKMDYGSDYR